MNDVFVKSNRWVATLKSGSAVEYLSKRDLICVAMIGLSDEKIRSVRQNSSVPILSYHYFDQINPVSGLDFVFESSFRNNFNSYAAPCQKTTIEIIGTNSSFSTPLSMNACSID